MEEKRGNTLTITIARNSDGEILRVVQCRSIFAGVAGDFGEADSCAISLNENSNGMDALAAANAVDTAIENFEKNNKEFALIRKLMNVAKKVTGFSGIVSEVANEESEEE